MRAHAAQNMLIGLLQSESESEGSEGEMLEALLERVAAHSSTYNSDSSVLSDTADAEEQQPVRKPLPARRRGKRKIRAARPPVKSQISTLGQVSSSILEPRKLGAGAGTRAAQAVPGIARQAPAGRWNQGRKSKRNSKGQVRRRVATRVAY